MDTESLKTILDDVISLRLDKIGLKRHDQYLWFSENINSIRKVFRYNLLKGDQGTFAWGVCIDFIPTDSGNNLRFHRTDKSVTLHLFEWTDEYANSFFGGNLKGGVTNHQGKDETKKTITRLLDKYENKIIDFYNETSTIEKIIHATERQIKEQKSYNFHYPNPKYLLPFLLSANGQFNGGISTLHQLDFIEEGLKSKIENELKKIADRKSST